MTHLKGHNNTLTYLLVEALKYLGSTKKCCILIILWYILFVHEQYKIKMCVLCVNCVLLSINLGTVVWQGLNKLEGLTLSNSKGKTIFKTVGNFPGS